MLNCLDKAVSGTSESILLCINHTHLSFNTLTKTKNTVEEESLQSREQLHGAVLGHGGALS